MQILIIKDSATKIAREVEGQADVDALRSQGFDVEVVGEPAPAAEVVDDTATAPKKPSRRIAA